MEKEDSGERSRISSPVAGQDGETSKQHKEGQEKNFLPTEIKEDGHEDENSSQLKTLNSPPPEELKAESNVQREEQVESVAEKIKEETPVIKEDRDEDENSSEIKNLNSPLPEKLVEESNIEREKEVQSLAETNFLNTSDTKSETQGEKGSDDSNKESNDLKVDLGNLGAEKNLEEVMYGEDVEPVFDGTEVPGMEANRSLSSRSLENDSETQGSLWPEKAVAIKNFVREKSLVAVSNVLRRLSGKSDDGQDVSNEKDTSDVISADPKKVANSSEGAEAQEVSQKSGERSGWKRLRFIGISHDTDAKSNAQQIEEEINKLIEPIPTKGRIILYTRLGSQECKEARLFLHYKRLRYVEINIDVYPTRKLELEKFAGSSAVPRVFFNEVLVGGLSELKEMDESGKLAEKIDYIISEAPSSKAPLPPLSGEDDMSSVGTVDELAVIVRKMKKSIVVKDRFYKMRRFTNCFLGSEAVDFLSEDQYLEREEAVEFGRKLAIKLFIQHVLDENLFEDGNHVYRFLDDDPFVSQCQNIPRGITEAKPKPITDVSSRLTFLCYAIYEAYTSEDGKHVDYRSIHGSEEFARYLRIVEELQRVEMNHLPREEKLGFFINLYNMMAIHAILVWGHPSGVLERRKLFGEFKYVIGACTYSLSDIHNGILRGNQRPPYNLIKPFGLKDKRSKVALPYPEPLVHFALVCGTRSSPALRCYSPGDIDKELMDAAHNFLTSGGLIVDLDAKIASVSKILRWYSVDFGNNEVEVLKHAANYLEPADSQALLELLDKTQLKVVDQPYDWGLNH